MKKITRKALVIALIAGILVFCDGILPGLLKVDGSFTWIAFVSWTVFFGATNEERLKAIIGYIIGFLFAVAIIKMGDWFSVLNVKMLALGSIIATMLMNFLCIELENIEKVFPISISGIFVGMAMTFSGIGIGLTISNWYNSVIMLTVIVVYGILGLLSGWATLKFGVRE